MRRFNSSRIGLDQGTQVLFSDFQSGGPMWTADGPRESRHSVAFADPFSEPPSVMVGISMWDMDRETNVRADIAAENVSTSGFDLVFRTWGDTRVARIRADWMAIGPLTDADDWVLD